MKLPAFVRMILPGALLVTGLPALAKSLPPLDAYGDLPSIEDLAMSPSGKELAVVGKIEGERRLLVIGSDHKARVKAPLGDAKLLYVEWAGEDIVIVATSATQNLGIGFTKSKHEFYGATLVFLDSGKTDLVFKKTPSMANAVWGNYGVRFIGGKWRGYFGGVRFKRGANGMEYEFDHGRPHLFAVDLAGNRAEEVAPAASEGHWRDWLVDGNGNVAATLDINSVNGEWKITNERGSALASGVDPTGGVGLVSFNHTGSSLIYSVEDDAEQRVQWFEVPLAGGAPREILAGVNVDRKYVEPDNGRLLGYLDGNSSKPVLFDPTHQSVSSKVYQAFANLDVDIEQWTPDFNHVLVHTSGNGDSGTWYSVDMTKMKADPVGYERLQISPEQVGPVSTLSYRAADGLELDGVLTLPPGGEAKNLPVILLPHGGPHTQDRARFDWWAQAFASRGYAVFQPNFRGSTNHGDAFRRAGDGQWGRKMQTDISDGLAELVEKGIADPKRACIMGGSYGGYAALAGITLQRGLYRCAVAVAPVSDLGDMYWTDFRESGNDKMLKRRLNESLGDPKTFEEVSPRRHAAEADAPILLVHGKDDTVVPFKQSAAMADALESAGKPHELVVLSREDHWLSHAETRKQMLKEAMRFIQKYNPAYQEP